MFRSRLAKTVAVSLLVHAVLAFVFFTRAGGSAGRQPKLAPGELKWVDALPPAPVVEAVKPTRAQTKSVKTRAAKASEQPRELEVAQAAVPKADEAPSAKAEAPRALSLVPSLDLSTGGGLTVPSHGKTLRPADVQVSAGEVRAGDEARVRERVNGFTEDDMATARAQNGLTHPYLMGMRSAGAAALDRRAREEKMGASGQSVLASIAERYLDATASYGKSGDPGLGPPGTTPRLSEQLAKQNNASELGALRLLAQSTETQNDLTQGKPFLMLQFEFRQFRDGAQSLIKIVRRSKDARFDAFVVAEWPKSIEALPPPPADAFHGPELRSVWQIEGWARLPKAVEEKLAYMPMPGVMGVGADKVAAALGEVTYRYEFQAKLLRAY